MNAIIKPSSLQGAVQAPASKSVMQRACAAALLHRGRTIIRQPGHSNDDKASLDIIAELGAIISREGNDLLVESKGTPMAQNASIHCGESGLAMRMFTPIAALGSAEVTIHGEGSLVNRPLGFFEKVLPQLGVHVESTEGSLPLKVRGPLKPANITIDGSLSSQFLTGLLMAYSAALQENKLDQKETLTINVRNLKSRPYINLTLEMLRHFGMPVPEKVNYEQFIFHGGYKDPGLAEVTYTVEGDWSGAAFLLVAGAIAGPVTVRGLDLLSAQADKAIIDILMAANAGVAVEAKGIIVHPGELHSFRFDATDCPDLFPPAAVLAAYCEGESVIRGVSRLAYKESNRGLTLQKELGKMGVKIDLAGDEMIIHGNGRLHGGDVSSSGDHRIAMACAIAGLAATGETRISDAAAVQKSYRDFFDDLKSLGADVSLDNKFTWHE